MPSDFFFVYSYSRATYIDHGGVHFTLFSCPQSARWRLVASSLFALRPGLSQKDEKRTKEITKERQRKAPSPPRGPTPRLRVP